MSWRIPVFGVRHLSPGAAWHLRAFLDEHQPKVVCIECIHDAQELVPFLTKPGTKPPIALLAYTDSLPVRTILLPYAEYSPEYQAMLWAKEHRAKVEFIDLPSELFLGLEEAALQRRLSKIASKEQATPESEPDTENNNDADAAPLEAWKPEANRSIYDRIAALHGEPDYDSYWERRFEHNLNHDSYRRAAEQFGEALRDEPDPPAWRAENLIREAYMRRRLTQIIPPNARLGEVVAVVGAFHAPVLHGELPPISEDELARLPRRKSKLTLMPYSFARLSSQSGYGAGNHAPRYFQTFWEALNHGGLAQLPQLYFTELVRDLREKGTHRSTAEVIEAVRLAQTVAAMRDGYAPTLCDLQDAAITLFGHGERSVVAEALHRVNIGTAIGTLPPGVTQTSIQADFARLMNTLKLEKYQQATAAELQLDLRENRHVKTEAAAFLDRNRSTFFHRLRVLGISFATPMKLRQDNATWAEAWRLQWSPESEIQLVEAVLLGETIELATAYKFKQILEESGTIHAAADVVVDACQCELAPSLDQARTRLQALAAVSSDFPALAHAAFQLSQVVRYGDVRKLDPRPLLPLMQELYTQATLHLHAAANCDNNAAKEVLHGIDLLNRVSLDHHEWCEETYWIQALRPLAAADDRNPKLSGYAAAILLERGLMETTELAREVSRRLSPGIPADLGAGWFEGLAQRNRAALLARQALWEELARYVQSLDGDEFLRAVVFLRRAFGDFTPAQKRTICENLGEFWGLGAELASEALNTEITEIEQQTLDELNEFDFDHL